MAQALVAKGHNVTVITTLPLNEPNPGYRHIKLPNHDIHPQLQNIIEQNSTFGKINAWFTKIGQMIKYSSDTIKSKEIQQLMATESFDLLIFGYYFNDFYVA